MSAGGLTARWNGCGAAVVIAELVVVDEKLGGDMTAGVGGELRAVGRRVDVQCSRGFGLRCRGGMPQGVFRRAQSDQCLVRMALERLKSGVIVGQ